MINSIPFSSIPSKDFFNTSSIPEVREIMQKAMHVVVLKACNYINDLVVKSKPFTIFSIEMESFSE